MKTTGLTKLRSLKPFLAAASLIVFGTSIGLAQEARVDARPLTPQEIADNGLENVHPSGGLMTVGIGEPVYLEALVELDTVVNSVLWSIEQRPVTNPVSSAQLQESPLPVDMPIYSPGDRYLLEAADRMLFVPDQPGQYKIQAVVSTDSGSLVLNGTVTAAMYTGVGIMGADTPSYPQCALCHEENAIGWAGTGHAGFFAEAVDGLASDHYSENCISCHVLGGHVPEAENGGFPSVARELGWTFPAVLEPGNWDAMPVELQTVASIQCEHCHGAGSEHHGDKTATSISYSAGDCGQCHDSGTHHTKNREWNLSGHAVVTTYPTGEGRGSCVRCHSAKGFVQTVDDAYDTVSTDYEAISCAACHDPHDGTNHGQVRKMDDVVLENGEIITEGGAGKLCMNCHMSRRDADSYVEGNVSSHFGPHYSVQTDMVFGTNAIEYDGKVKGRPSAHMYAMENGCTGCHMQELESDNPALYEAGGHTFKLVWDAGTPDDHSDDVDQVGACQECHGPMEDFNLEIGDLNYDGHIDGVKHEIEELLEALAMYLPPKGQPVYEYPGSSYEWTISEKKALYNYLVVEEDGSHGMHNPSYAAAILRASINDMADPFNSIFGGLNIPAGGEWFYSEWFEFYAPMAVEGLIFHYDHGELYVDTDGEKIYLYDYRAGVWRYTTPELYPIMYDATNKTWEYYGGKAKHQRYFYKYGANEWSYTK